MKNFIKYLLVFILPLYLIAGCTKSQLNDTSFVTAAAGVTNLAAMFNITHDNTGIVTITPNSSGATSYDVYMGDNTTMPVSVVAGQSIKHTFIEGTFQVKIVAHDIKGGTATITTPLVVSFLAPQNLVAKVTATNLNVTVSATAKYATNFKVYYGDSTKSTPVPFATAMPGQTISHTYPAAGTYIVNVIAQSGGSETTTYADTITVGKQIDLPVTFDDKNVNYAVNDFGGNSSSIVLDPTSTSNHVMKSIKTSGAAFYAGTTVSTSLGFATRIPMKAATSKMSVMVYSPAVGLDVKLKLDNHLNPNNGVSVETDVKTTVANKWETLTFDFKNQAPGTPALNDANTYDNATIFFDFGNPGKGSVFYFDNMQMAVALKQINVPVTYEDATVDYTVSDFGSNYSSVVPDPANGLNHVLKTTKPSGAATWAGTTIGTGLGFASAIPLTASSTKMTVMVYSPAAGLDIKLKLENHGHNIPGIETDVFSTVANQWETLTFDFNNSSTNKFNPANSYDLASIFFDFNHGGSGLVFYSDNLMVASGGGSTGPVLSQMTLPVTFEDPTVNYALTDFEGSSSKLMVDSLNSNNHVVRSSKPVGGKPWAGVTLGAAPNGFASPIPLTASRTKMSVDVLTPAIGTRVHLKIEDHTDQTKSVETDAYSTVAGQYETLVFDFSKEASGTAKLNLGYSYDKASIFFDFLNDPKGLVFYWDNVKFL